MPHSSRFPVIVGPPEPKDKAEALTKAIGKTIASVEFGKEQPSSERHQAEAMILYFTDGSSMAIVTGSNASDHVDKTLTKADDVETNLDVLWKTEDESEREAFDDVMGM